MKHIIPFVLFFTLVFSQYDIEGRWHLVGYEDNIMYQFENNYYIDAVHMTFLGEPKLKKGAIIKVINQETIFRD